MATARDTLRDTIRTALDDAGFRRLVGNDSIIGAWAESITDNLMESEEVSVTETNETTLDVINEGIRQKRRAIDAENRLKKITAVVNGRTSPHYVHVADILRILEAE